MKRIAFVLAVLMMMSSSPVYSLDLTIPDGLHGEQVALTRGEQNQIGQQYLTRVEHDEQVDKTRDTIAIVAWVLLGLIGLSMQDGDGNDGGRNDGGDGISGGGPAGPSPPHGCR